MGTQVSFFMSFEDEQDFLAAVRAQGPFMLVRSSFEGWEATDIRDLQPIEASPLDADLCMLPTESLDSLLVRRSPGRRYSCIEIGESEVVQFNRCQRGASWLKEGRLWYASRTSQGKKSAAFLAWSRAVFRIINRRYSRDSVGRFVGPGAKKGCTSEGLGLGAPAHSVLSVEERMRVLGGEESGMSGVLDQNKKPRENP